MEILHVVWPDSSLLPSLHSTSCSDVTDEYGHDMPHASGAAHVPSPSPVGKLTLSFVVESYYHGPCGSGFYDNSKRVTL